MIRVARRTDHEALLDLWEALQRNGTAADPRYRPTPDARQHMRAWTATSWFDIDPFPRVLVFADDEGIVGFIHGFPRTALPILQLEPTARIADLFVTASHRRAGIGRGLVEAFIARAQAASYPRFEVGTLAADGRAVEFWREMGFGDWQVNLSRNA